MKKSGRVIGKLYNCVLKDEVQAALLADQFPRQLSFKHAVQVWNTFQGNNARDLDANIVNELLFLIAQPKVGLRPRRIEPRAITQRPKPYPLLTKHRTQARGGVRQHGHLKKQR